MLHRGVVRAGTRRGLRSAVCLVFWGIAGGNAPTAAQTEPPAFKMMRSEEDYSYIRSVPAAERSSSDRYKYIPLSADGNAFLSLGGEVRFQYEFFENEDWGEISGTSDFLLSRYVLHSDLHLGRRVRAFGQLKSAFVNGRDEPGPVDEDQLDLHQGFVDLGTRGAGDTNLTLRLGRQEMAYGAARLVGLREGPNVRRSFDAARLVVATPKVRIDGFLGREVKIDSDVFADSGDDNAVFGGAYAVIKIPFFVAGITDVYYFGLDRDAWRYDEGTRGETRHTIGIRRWRTAPAFRFNTELIFQFGSFGDGSIRAWSFYTDYHYRFREIPFSPVPGVKVDILSGDSESGDGDLNTYSPLFSNPAYFGLLTVMGPANLIDVHPSVELELHERVSAMAEWAFFWRQSLDDGLYNPVGALRRTGQTSDERFIGDQLGLEVVYQYNRYFRLKLEASYFRTGPYLEDTGEHKNITHMAWTGTLLF